MTPSLRLCSLRDRRPWGLALLALLTVSSVTGAMQVTVTFFGIWWVEDTHAFVSHALIVVAAVHVLGVVLNLFASGLTGFVFDQPDVPSLKAALDRLFLLWQSPGTWSGMRQNAMRQDFGWPASARQYHALYRELRPGA